MKILLAVVGLLLTACRQTDPEISAAGSRAVAIRRVTVVDVLDGSLHADQTAVIEGNRIVAVGPAAEVRVPSDADLIDGAGGYLIPGLWDMHVHSVTNIALDTAIESVAARDWHFPLFVAYGVTGVRDMNDGTGDAVLALTKSVKRRLAAGELHGPRLLAAGPSIDGHPHLGTNSVEARTAAEARAVVDKLADNGADLVKPYENLSRDAYFAIVDQARRRGLPVAGHEALSRRAPGSRRRRATHRRAPPGSGGGVFDHNDSRTGKVCTRPVGVRPVVRHRPGPFGLSPRARALRQPGSGGLRPDDRRV
jgi:hypothetical protein